MQYRLVLAFGSNLGEREVNFTLALKFIKEYDPSLEILRQSNWITTTPFQSSEYCTKNHENYLNFVCDVSTFIHPFRFYHDIIVPIEDAIGHSRTEKWAPRALDIDILLAAVNNKFEFSECSPLIIENETFFLPHKSLLDAERKVLLDLLQTSLNIQVDDIKCLFTLIMSDTN